jgi:hypothetical protein
LAKKWEAKSYEILLRELLRLLRMLRLAEDDKRLSKSSNLTNPIRHTRKRKLIHDTHRLRINVPFR